MDNHADYWTDPSNGIDDNDNGLIDESVKFIVALADIGQPYTCEQWGNQGIDGIPVIIEDPGTIFNWLHDDYNAYPTYAILDHELKIADKPWPYGSSDNLIQTLYENCEEAGLCGNIDSDNDGLVGLDDNCPNEFNPDQADSDDDGLGDICDDCYNYSGDLNSDGLVNINDIFTTLNIISTGGISSDQFSICEKSNADYNSDNIINILDVIQIINQILGNTVQYCHCGGEGYNLHKSNIDAEISFISNRKDLNIIVTGNHLFSGVQLGINSENIDVTLLNNNHIRIETNYHQGITHVIAYSLTNKPFENKKAVFTIRNGANLNPENISITVGDTHGNNMNLIKSDEINIWQNGPHKFELTELYPNPFNPKTEINFSLAQEEYITLTAYNVNGQEVDVIFDGYQEVGTHSYTWDASNFSSGVYYIKLSNGTNQAYKKAILLK